MKFLVCSDIHLDTYNPSENDVFKKQILDILDIVDWLIIAGDVCNGVCHPSNKKLLNDFFGDGIGDKTIFIPGNHDYWQTSFNTFEKEKSKLPFKYILDNEELVLDKHNPIKEQSQFRIFGGTLWFPLIKDPMMYLTDRWPDFVYIRDYDKIFVKNEEFTRKLYEIANQHLGYTNKPFDLIISHHLPSHACVHPSFKNEKSNIFFVGEAAGDISLTKNWVYGHTHTPANFKINKTRMLCNPRAYPNERSGNYEPIIIEV